MISSFQLVCELTLAGCSWLFLWIGVDWSTLSMRNRGYEMCHVTMQCGHGCMERSWRHDGVVAVSFVIKLCFRGRGRCIKAATAPHLGFSSWQLLSFCSLKEVRYSILYPVTNMASAALGPDTLGLLITKNTASVTSYKTGT